MKADIVLLGPNLHQDALTETQFDELKQIIATFSSLGTIFVSPAGNLLTEVDVPSVFKTIKEVIIVGSHTFENTIQPYSYYGDEVDVYAPGDRLLCAKQDGQDGYLSGTKAAAAFLTGVLALLVQYCKNESIDLTINEWKNLLLSSGIPLVESQSESKVKKLLSSEKLFQQLERSVLKKTKAKR